MTREEQIKSAYRRLGGADPSAPYDGYEGSDDTEEGAGYTPLGKAGAK